MERYMEFVTGDFDGGVLRKYLGIVCAIYWSLIFACIGLFPEHKFSIMSYTYSALGSYNGSNNPQWWWLFSIAMVLWGVAMIPVVCYNYRRMRAISSWAALIGAFFMMLGGIGISLVGIFPDAHGTVFGTYEIREIHKYVALIGAGAYMLSNISFGLMLIWDALKGFFSGDGSDFDHKWFVPPYLIWAGVFGTGLYFQFKWETVYEGLKATAIAAGQPVPGHFGAALGTRYSFALWENLTIYSLFIFIIWSAMALQKEEP